MSSDELNFHPYADSGSSPPAVVSFIVPSYNSSATLPLCLHSIRNQDATVAREVIVVDSSDDGKTAGIAGAFPEMKFIRLAERTNPAKARNLGLAEATAAWCAFVDADVVLSENWLTNALKASSGDVAGMCSSVEPYPDTNSLGFCHFLIQFSKFLPFGSPRKLPIIPSFAFLLRRSEAGESGGFPEDFPMLEDFLFSQRLSQRTGRPFLFCPAMKAFHINRRHWAVISSQLRNHGTWSARARCLAQLPGTTLREFPLAVPLLVPYRLGLILARTARWNLNSFVRALMLSPVMIAALILWAGAFYREMVKKP
jgi:GT2 family glycosyltransferase